MKWKILNLARKMNFDGMKDRHDMHLNVSSSYLLIQEASVRPFTKKQFFFENAYKICLWKYICCEL